MQASRRLKVIICGGGIAGFATALLLRGDHDVTILESSRLNEETGAAITLVVPRLKLAVRVQTVGVETGTVHNACGREFPGDVILGADGIRSASGASVFGPPRPPRVCRHTAA
jgi:2-polyprenyl-6-methoxyphenol hydroxylase-like FAD-dependent oxidoreductase